MKLCMGCMEHYDDALTICPHCGASEDMEPENAMHMAPGTILMERYIIGRVIGYGGFGVTYIGWDALLNTRIAVKEYLPSDFSTRIVGQTSVTVFGGDKQEQFEDGMKKFIDEAKKLARFHSCSGIVRIFDSFESNNTAYIIMELLEGETLAERLEREHVLSPADTIAMLSPVMESLSTIHREGIIHRDIAPDNIFITKDGAVKLIDFGAARYATTTHSRSLTVIIKPGYSPEEQYRSRSDQGPHTDVYAVAATMYRMLTGEVPPDALERRAFFENKKKDILTPPGKLCKALAANQETALLNALNVRVEDRTPDMDTFMEELASPTPVRRRNGRIRVLDVYRWPLWAKIGVPVSAAAVVTFLVLFFTGVIGFDAGLQRDIYIPDGQTRVPSVISAEYTEGEERLSAARLLIEIGGTVSSAQIPSNHILTQNVSGGMLVQENTLIGVTVSAGVITQLVPDVAGMEAGEAVRRLTSFGFVCEQEERFDSTIAAGCIISQEPAANEEVPEGSTVKLIVSKGIDPDAQIEERSVTVPDFTGKTYQEVTDAARSLGITIQVTERRYSRDIPKNSVLSQTPAGGTEMKNTEPLRLVLSLGFDQVEVPNVLFMSEEKAKSQLEGRGLKADVTYQESDTVAAGLVMSQKPGEKTKVDVESAVTLVISTGSPAFAVPTVIGQQEAAAVQALSAKGLAVNVSYEQNDSAAEGAVLSQEPAGSSTVRRGDSVTLVVCTHHDVTAVPDVTGISRSDAENAVRSAGFSANIVTLYDSTVPAGSVISQNPGAGTSLQRGDTVTLHVSLGKDPAAVTEPPVIATQAPATAAPTQAPTKAPATAAPTQAPTTAAPTQVPTTAAPTQAPTTAAPTQDPHEVTGVTFQSVPAGAKQYSSGRLTAVVEPEGAEPGEITWEINGGYIAPDGTYFITGQRVAFWLEAGDCLSYTGDIPCGGYTPEDQDAYDHSFAYEEQDGGLVITGGSTTGSGYLVIPAAIDGVPVTQIAPFAFSSRDDIQTVILPDSIEVISEYAFTNCPNIDSLCIGEHTSASIGDGAFQTGGSSLYAVALPAGIMSIGADAFNSGTVLFADGMPAELGRSSGYTVYSQTDTVTALYQP